MLSFTSHRSTFHLINNFNRHFSISLTKTPSLIRSIPSSPTRSLHIFSNHHSNRFIKETVSANNINSQSLNNKGAFKFPFSKLFCSPTAGRAKYFTTSTAHAGANDRNYNQNNDNKEKGSSSDDNENKPLEKNYYAFYFRWALRLGALSAFVWCGLYYYFIYSVPVNYPPGPQEKAHGSQISVYEPLERIHPPPLPLLKRIYLALLTCVRVPFIIMVWLPAPFLLLLFGPSAFSVSYIVFAMESCGPAFIKLGQWAATRPDLFESRVTNILSSLQASAPNHSFSYSQRVCRESFPDQFEKTLFINSEVIGSGSMAQVHSGYIITESGERQEVAIKIVHPNVHDLVYCDLRLMATAAQCIDYLPGGFHWLGLGDAVAEFSYFLENHLNLINEAHSLRRMKANFANWPQIEFPTPIDGLASKLVLVETLCKGTSLSTLIATTSPEFTDERLTYCEPDQCQTFTKAHGHEIARLGLHMFLAMMIDHNFMHCDLHPGNMLIQSDCEACNKALALHLIQAYHGGGSAHSHLSANFELPSVCSHDKSSSTTTNPNFKLVVLDPGLVTHLNRRNRENFLALFGALVHGDGYLAGHLIVERAKVQDCPNPELFKRDIQDLLSKISLFKLGAASIGKLMRQVLDIARTHRVRLESDFASLVVGLLVVEGVGRALDPELSLILEAIPQLIANPEARKIMVQAGGIRLLDALVDMAKVHPSRSVSHH